MRDISEILPHITKVEWIPRIEYHGENSNDPVFGGYRLYLNRHQEAVEDRWDMKDAIREGIKESERKKNLGEKIAKISFFRRQTYQIFCVRFGHGSKSSSRPSRAQSSRRELEIHSCQIWQTKARISGENLEISGRPRLLVVDVCERTKCSI